MSYVSVADLPQFCEVSESQMYAREVPIMWDLQLPAHIDTERMQINIDRLERIHKVGAFSASHVREYYGETDEINSVGSVNEDGSITAAKSKQTRKADPTRSDNHQLLDFGGLSRNYGFPVARHSINRNQAVDDVIELKQKGTSDEMAWAHVLDGALRQSLRKNAKANLIDKATPYGKIYWPSFVSYCAIAGASDVMNGGVSIVPAMYAGFFALAAGADTSLLKKYAGKPFAEQRRWSAFISEVQLDRFVGAWALTKSQQLITVRP